MSDIPLSRVLEAVLLAAGRPVGVEQMRELFEEQIAQEQAHHAAGGLRPARSDMRRLTPAPERFAHGPEDYLEHLARLRQALSIPVIASLNGTTLGGWLAYARYLQQAGASALELNVYSVASDPHPTMDSSSKDNMVMTVILCAFITNSSSSLSCPGLSLTGSEQKTASGKGCRCRARPSL